MSPVVLVYWCYSLMQPGHQHLAKPPLICMPFKDIIGALTLDSNVIYFKHVIHHNQMFKDSTYN